MAKKSLKTKIVISLVAINLIIFGIFYLNNLQLQKVLIKDFEDAYAKQLNSSVSSCLVVAEREAGVLTDSLLSHPEIKQALLNRDRKALEVAVQPLYQVWSQEHHVSQLNFFTPDAQAFYRAQKPEKYGDDLSYRKALNEAIGKKKRIMAAEEGSTGYGIRCIEPIVVDGRVAGIYEVGISLEESVGEALLETGRGQYAIFSLKKDAAPALLWQSSDLKTALNKDDIARLVNGENFYRESADRALILCLVPVKDIDGQTIAFIQGEISRDKFINAEKSARNRSLLVIIISLLAVCGMAYLVLHRALRNLKPLRRSMVKAAEGDLTAVIDISHQDEIGKVAHGFSSLLGRFREVVYSLFTNTSRLTTNAAFMNDVASSAVIRLEESAHGLELVGDKLKESGQNLGDADTGVEEIAGAAMMVAEQAQNLQNAYINLTQTAESSKEDVYAVEKMGEAMRQRGIEVVQEARALEKMSQSIGEITGTIMSVSEQTNLLALNAAIESARAGEHGRGFAVVAEEVRKLAEETAGYTREISKLIDGVQSNISSFVGDIQNMSQAIEESNQTTGRVMGSIEQILRQIVSIQDAVMDITSAMQEQSASSQEISAVVNTVSHTMTTLIGDLDGAIINIKEQMVNFKEMVNIADETNEVSNQFRQIMGQYTIPDEIVLKQVQEDHRGFVTKYDFIISHNLAARPEDVTDHINCRLGKWADGLNDENKRQIYDQVVMDPHKRVHALAREAVDLNNAGDKALAQVKVKAMHEASDEVIAAIEKLISVK